MSPRSRAVTGDSAGLFLRRRPDRAGLDPDRRALLPAARAAPGSASPASGPRRARPCSATCPRRRRSGSPASTSIPHYDAAQPPERHRAGPAGPAGGAADRRTAGAPATTPSARGSIVLGFGALYEGGLARVADLGAPGQSAHQPAAPGRGAALAGWQPVPNGSAALEIHSTQLCAGAGRDETCVGDSGAPLVAGDAGRDRSGDRRWSASAPAAQATGR